MLSFAKILTSGALSKSSASFPTQTREVGRHINPTLTVIDVGYGYLWGRKFANRFF